MFDTSENFFKPIPFIADGASAPLLDKEQFPFLYNSGGKLEQLAQPKGRLITMSPEEPGLEMGQRYSGIRHWPKEIVSPYGNYQITEFDFGVQEVRYASLPANARNAQAFGMTLLHPGECVRFQYDQLVMSDYTYGKWAGYQSPYIGAARELELLTINPTDLEFHDFPHVFVSRDDVPLVISVARWRVYVNEISLADLWIAPGDAIVLPPKLMPPPPEAGMPEEYARRLVVDMHGNRNSAQACRFVEGKPALATTTVLANSTRMSEPEYAPRYHEEKHATLHVKLPFYQLEQADQLATVQAMPAGEMSK
ncbi:hypothetical protein PQR62_14135 [Herbaspirillum lusitanum]|uniref:Uncharacterized protein n=1 Tax=Herbaspirillum lusitanum TaxID=213312 RepID=A0ABW9A940_9BURK